MRHRLRVACVTLAVATVAAIVSPGPLSARGLKLAIGDVGLGIGDVPRLDGLRLNFRDHDLELVRGLNATVWSPHSGTRGVVQGLAVGLPLTGAGTSRASGSARGSVSRTPSPESVWC